MPGLYNHTTRNAGTVLTAAIYNADHQKHIDNATPQMHDDYSVDVAQMRLQADPGEVGTESLATNTAGELERLRFAIREIKGTTHWYQSPQFSMIGLIPTGTLMLFQQTAAPTGWTKQTTHNNKALRVVSGTASSGGANPFTSIFGAGKLTGGTAINGNQMPSHTHTVPDPGHAHSVTDFTHAHAFSQPQGSSGSPGLVDSGNASSSGFGSTAAATSNILVNGAFTGISSTNPSGAGQAHDHAVQLDLQFVDIIIASKD